MASFEQQARAWGRARGGTFRVRPEGLAAFREALAYGTHDAGLAVEGASKALTPVHGDPTQGGPFATFAPGVRPIGGTLRRSQTTVTYLDGRRIAGPERDDNGEAVPDRHTSQGIQTVVGTHLHYARYVHDGTVRMRARPFLATGMLQVKDDIPSHIAAGAARHMGGVTRRITG